MVHSSSPRRTPSLSTRVFMNGNSQAVRIPQEFRLDCQRVQISRNAEGDLVLHPLPPIPEKRGQALLKALSRFDPGFADILEEDRRHQPPLQDRDPL